MLKYELNDFMDVEQLAAFMRHEAEKTHHFIPLPDGRVLAWYPDEEVYAFQVAYEGVKDAESNHLPTT